MYYIDQKWKDGMRRLISQGINNPLIWQRRGVNEFINIDLSDYGISKTMSKRGNKNGSQSFHKFPREGIMYVCDQQQWETTTGYRQTDEKEISITSLFLGSIEVPLQCVAQGRVWSKGGGKVTATVTSPYI